MKGPEDVVALYYDAWINKRGDMSGVPLSPDFKLRGPVADFDDAESYRAMAREMGAMVTSFRVRQHFTDGNQVCPIILSSRLAMLSSRPLIRRRGRDPGGAGCAPGSTWRRSRAAHDRLAS